MKKTCISKLYCLFLVAIPFYFFCNSCKNNRTSSDEKKEQYFKDTTPSIATTLSDTSYNNADSLCSMMEKTLNKIKINKADSQYYYVVEGDLLMDGDQLYIYCLKKIVRQQSDSALV